MTRIATIPLQRTLTDAVQKAQQRLAQNHRQPELRTGMGDDVRYELADHQHGILDDVLAQAPQPQRFLEPMTDPRHRLE